MSYCFQGWNYLWNLGLFTNFPILLLCFSWFSALRTDCTLLIIGRFAFSEALQKMYGLKHNLSSLPPMPVDGDTWSVMHSWILPTRSFLEFVMFSRFECLNLLVYFLPQFLLSCSICRLLSSLSPPVDILIIFYFHVQNICGFTW